MSLAGEPDCAPPRRVGGPGPWASTRQARGPADDPGMVAEAVWHGGGTEKDFDALLRLIFDPIMERLHDTARSGDDGDACPW